MRPLALPILALAATAVLTSCGDGRERGKVMDLYGDPTSSTLELGIASCNQNPAATVDEKGDEIRIDLTVDSIGGGAHNDCADGLKVKLDAPLGSRPVIVNGDEVAVSPAEAP